MNRLIPFLLLLCAISVRGAESLHCEQLTADDYWASAPKSQKIRFSGQANVTKIVLKVSTGGTEVPLQVSIHTDKNGTGTLLGQSRSVTTNIADVSPEWVEFVCGRGGIPVTNDFWISLNLGLRWLSSSTENYEGTSY